MSYRNKNMSMVAEDERELQLVVETAFHGSITGQGGRLDCYRMNCLYLKLLPLL